MKIARRISFTLLLALGTYCANGQDFPEKKNTIKSNVFGIISGGTDAFAYERLISNKSALILGVGYSDSDESELNYLTYGVGLEYRYYIKNAFKGIYVSGGLSYSLGDVSGTELPKDLSFTNNAYSAKLGYQWLWKQGYTLGVDIGYIFKDYIYSNSENSTLDLRTTEGIPNLGLILGYSF